MEEVHAWKARLHTVQAGRCALCGTHLASDWKSSEIDHVIPRSRGGRDHLGNFVLAHSACNRRKANDMPTGCEKIWLFLVNAKLEIEA
jgi:5-methylcytosine-specific restriction endonuclease McrA